MTKKIINWTPEDNVFWEQEGKAIANRNLWVSTFALLLGFVVWQFMSIITVMLGDRFTAHQLFWLAAIPVLSGATLRIFYSFMPPIVGGGRWTVISTAFLLIPAVGLSYALTQQNISYFWLVILAVTCGFGGGNFSSSMNNINYFFPKKLKGAALGINAGIGNLGVSTVQFVAPLVIGIGIVGTAAQVVGADGISKDIWIQNITLVWVPLIVLATVLAYFFMNDLTSVKASFSEQNVIFKRKHNWLMCILYLGVFGSFIGFSAGFGLLMKNLFPDVHALRYAFLGPLLSALIRPFGGWLSDKIGGARVTLVCYIVLFVCAIAVIFFIPQRFVILSIFSSSETGNFIAFFSIFMILFFATGVGNGSTYRMIPVIFLTTKLKKLVNPTHEQRVQAIKQANTESAAVLGFAGSFAAFGGFFIPKGFGTSLELTGGVDAAFIGFAIMYVICLGITWWYYTRKNAEAPC